VKGGKQLPQHPLEAFDVDMRFRGIGGRGGMYIADMVDAGMRDQLGLPTPGKPTITKVQFALHFQELLRDEEVRWWVGKAPYADRATAEQRGARTGLEVGEGNRHGVTADLEARLERALAKVRFNDGPKAT
jgi:hypothetical protein